MGLHGEREPAIILPISEASFRSTRRAFDNQQRPKTVSVQREVDPGSWRQANGQHLSTYALSMCCVQILPVKMKLMKATAVLLATSLSLGMGAQLRGTGVSQVCGMASLLQPAQRDLCAYIYAYEDSRQTCLS